MSEMTKEDLLAWQEVCKLNERPIEELRKDTPEEKLRQVAILMSLARKYGWRTSTEEEVQMVRERWIQLYKAAGVMK